MYKFTRKFTSHVICLILMISVMLNAADQTDQEKREALKTKKTVATQGISADNQTTEKPNLQSPAAEQKAATQGVDLKHIDVQKNNQIVRPLNQPTVIQGESAIRPDVLPGQVTRPDGYTPGVSSGLEQLPSTVSTEAIKADNPSLSHPRSNPENGDRVQTPVRNNDFVIPIANRQKQILPWSEQGLRVLDADVVKDIPEPQVSEKRLPEAYQGFDMSGIEIQKPQRPDNGEAEKNQPWSRDDSFIISQESRGDYQAQEKTEITASQGSSPDHLNVNKGTPPQPQTLPEAERDMSLPIAKRSIISFEIPSEEARFLLDNRGIQYEYSNDEFKLDVENMNLLKESGIPFQKVGINFLRGKMIESGDGYPEIREDRDDMFYGENFNDYPIPDYQGGGVPGFNTSTIYCDEIGVVTGVTYYGEIVHTYPGDLTIEIVHSNVDDLIWDQLGGSNDGGYDDDLDDDDDIIFSFRETDTFNGLSVNGNWYLDCNDWLGGDTGYINWWAIDVYYLPPDSEPEIWNVYVVNELDTDNNDCLEYWEFEVDIDASDGYGYTAQNVYISVSDNYNGGWGAWGPFDFSNWDADDNVTIQGWNQYDYLFSVCTEVEFTFYAFNTLGDDTFLKSVDVEEKNCIDSPYDDDDHCYLEVISADSWCCDYAWDYICEVEYWDCADSPPELVYLYTVNLEDVDGDGCFEYWEFVVDVDAAWPHMIARNVYIEVYDDINGYWWTLGPYSFEGWDISDDVNLGGYFDDDFMLTECTEVDWTFTFYNDLGEITTNHLIDVDARHSAPNIFNAYIDGIDEDGDGCYEDWFFDIDIDAIGGGVAQNVYIDAWDNYDATVRTWGPFDFEGYLTSDNRGLLTYYWNTFNYDFEACTEVDFTFYAYNLQGDDTQDEYENVDADEPICADSPYSPLDPCYQDVIAMDPYCCDTYWDSICEGEYWDCYSLTCVEAPYLPEDYCYEETVMGDSWCCDIQWDSICQCEYNDCAGLVEDPPEMVNVETHGINDSDGDGWLEHWNMLVDINAACGEAGIASDVTVHFEAYTSELLGAWYFIWDFVGLAPDDVNANTHDWTAAMFDFDVPQWVTFHIWGENDLGQTSTFFLQVPVDDGCVVPEYPIDDENCWVNTLLDDTFCCDVNWDSICECDYLDCIEADNEPPVVINYYTSEFGDEDGDGWYEFWNVGTVIQGLCGGSTTVTIDAYDDVYGYWGSWTDVTYSDNMWNLGTIWADYYAFSTPQWVLFDFQVYNDYGSSTFSLNIPMDSTEMAQAPPYIFDVYVVNHLDEDIDFCWEYWEFEIDIDAAGGGIASNVYIDIYDDFHGAWWTAGPFDFVGWEVDDNVIIQAWNQYDYLFSVCTEVDFQFYAYNDLGDDTEQQPVPVDGMNPAAPSIWSVFPINVIDDDANGFYETWDFIIDIDALFPGEIAYDVFIDISDELGPWATIGPFDFVGVWTVDNVVWGTMFYESFNFTNPTTLQFTFYAENALGNDTFTVDVPVEGTGGCVDSPYDDQDICYLSVIDMDPWCCTNLWDDICQGEYWDCFINSCVEYPYPLDDPCWLETVDVDAYCCYMDWDDICQGEYDTCNSPPECNFMPGDFNQDNSVNVIDVVAVVSYILTGLPTLTECQLIVSDVAPFPPDGNINILDIVQIVDFILSRTDFPSIALDKAHIYYGNGTMRLVANGSVAGIQLELEGAYQIIESQLPEGWELQHANNRVLIYTISGNEPLGEMLFSYDGDLKIIDSIIADWQGNGITATIQESPDKFSLKGAFPNPFNPVTTISYEVPEGGLVEIGVYNMLGRKVASLVYSHHTPGSYQVSWNASGQPSGVYLVRMEAGSFSDQNKIMLVK